MLKNFLLSTSRALLRNRWHSAINIAGLTLGISCAIVIFCIVRFELSFDDYHAQQGRTYRIVTERNRFGEIDFTAGITYPLPAALRKDFPDLAYITIDDSNITPPVLNVTSADGSRKLFKETKFSFVDPDYFKIFSYTWIEGSPEKALTEEKTAVLTESLAKKYFGEQSALGQIILFDSKFPITVTGVVKDPPLNTDLSYKILFSNKLGADAHAWTDWASSSSSINCYIQLSDHVTALDFENKLKGWHKKYFTGEARQDGETMNYFLQPLSQVHFDTRFGNHGNRVLSKKILFSLAFIGAMLLVTACINFVNLNTVLIISRSKEVGVRKSLGGSKANIIVTFLGETFMIAAASLILSVGIVQLMTVFLASLLGYTLTINFFTDPVLTLFAMVLLMLVTLLAGLYPGMSLGSFQPIRALKSSMYDSLGEGVNLRRVLIGFQLLISQGLVICSIIVVQQLAYFSEQPMGLNSSSVVEFELPARKPIELKLLKERLQAIPGVHDVCMSNTGSTANDRWGSDFEATVKESKVKGDASIKFADNDYLKTYQLTLLAGNDLPPSDTVRMFLINEAAVKAMGFAAAEDAIGTSLNTWGKKALIGGVVKDYHTTSLRDAIGPVIIMSQSNNYFRTAVRLDTQDIAGTLEKIERAWKNTYPDYVFEYEFLDDTIGHFYDSERQTSKLITIASVIAILIGAIGLLGLASFSVTRRTKEIGIRKTLGASIASIIALFSREFVLLVIVSFAFAAPTAYFLMDQWLNNFAYHVQPGFGPFAIGMVLSAVVVLGTVGFMSYSAAIANPVDAFKYE